MTETAKEDLWSWIKSACDDICTCPPEFRPCTCGGIGSWRDTYEEMVDWVEAQEGTLELSWPEVARICKIKHFLIFDKA